MENDTPEKITEAKSLFEESINHTNHKLKALCFEEAVDLLDEYLLEHPGTPHKGYIANLKTTYLKELIKGLASIRESDVDNDLVKYIVIISKVDKEFRKVCEQHPKLENEFKDFLDFFKDYIK